MATIPASVVPLRLFPRSCVWIDILLVCLGIHDIDVIDVVGPLQMSLEKVLAHKRRFFKRTKGAGERSRARMTELVPLALVLAKES